MVSQLDQVAPPFVHAIYAVVYLSHPFRGGGGKCFTDLICIAPRKEERGLRRGLQEEEGAGERESFC